LRLAALGPCAFAFNAFFAAIPIAFFGSLGTIHGLGNEAGGGAGTADEKKYQHHGNRHQGNGYNQQRKVICASGQRHCR
jgi:hypothetical protein